MDFIGELIENMIAVLMTGIINGIISFTSWITNGLMDYLTPIYQIRNEGWEQLLAPLFTLITNLQNSIIIPVAMQLLTLVLLIRLVSVSKIAESNDMQPLVPKIAIILLTYFFGTFIVANSGAIITIIYDLCQAMINTIYDAEQASGIFGIATIEPLEEGVEATIAGLVAGIFGAIVLMIAAVVACLLSVFMYWSKVIKLYIQAFFAPLATSFLFLDATRQWGLGYIKGVAANMLSIVLIVFIINIFPHVLWGVLGSAGSVINVNGVVTGEPGMIGTMISMVIVYLLLIFFMVKSSSLAREILGG